MTTQFNDKAALMNALAPAGQRLTHDERAKILYAHDNRALALNTGANVTIYTGDTVENSRLLLVRRRSTRTGQPDGIGALGGMSERTKMNPDAFAALPLEEKARLASEKDDVVALDDNYILTNDISVIAPRTIRRELREELADLGLQSDEFGIDYTQLEDVPLPDVRDDNYILNIWDGHNPPPEGVFAVTPVCTLLQVNSAIFDKIAASGAEAEASHEMLGLEGMALHDALPRWGKTGGITPAKEDNRDLSYDYRYPHEWLSAWAIASKQLNHDADKLIALATETQQYAYAKDSNHRIDFPAICRRMGVTLELIDSALQLPPGTAQRMDAAIIAVPIVTVKRVTDGPKP